MVTAATEHRLGKRKITEKEEQYINHVAAPLVNTIYSIAMCIEGYSLDSGETEIYKAACRMRAKIYETNKETAIPFGDWAEQLENELNKVKATKQDILYWLCAKIYALTVEMRNFYRKYDHEFTFYQEDEILVFKRGQGMFKKNTAKECNEIVWRARYE